MTVFRRFAVWPACRYSRSVLVRLGVACVAASVAVNTPGTALESRAPSAGSVLEIQGVFAAQESFPRAATEPFAMGVLDLQRALAGDEVPQEAASDVPVLWAALPTLLRELPASVTAYAPIASLTTPSVDVSHDASYDVGDWTLPPQRYRYLFNLTAHAPPRGVECR